MIDVKNMRDYTERVWFLGTKILSDEDGEETHDLILMDEGREARFNKTGGPAVFYHVPLVDDHYQYFIEKVKGWGYSERFVSIIDEAHRRGYVWIYFDRDIETEDVTELEEEKMTVEELKNKYGGSGWNNHPDHDREDWQLEAECGDTCVGYWSWVMSMVERDADDRPDAD